MKQIKAVRGKGEAPGRVLSLSSFVRHIHALQGKSEKLVSTSPRKGVIFVSCSGLGRVRIISECTDEVKPVEFEYTRAF
jgi:hypothetical protein